MDCPTCEAMVDAYVDGELTATESADFERALSVCAECRKRLDAARTVGNLLRDLPAEPAPDLLRARIERELRGIAGRTPVARPSNAGRGERMRWMAMANQYKNQPGITAAGAMLANQKHSALPVPITQAVTTSVSDGGFNWSDAGIGASVSFGAALLLLTAIGLGRRSRSRGLASV